MSYFLCLSHLSTVSTTTIATTTITITITTTSTTSSSSNKPANTNATSTTKWSDIRKHENLFTKVPIFKNTHHSLNSRRCNYFSHDVTVKDIYPEEDLEEEDGEERI